MSSSRFLRRLSSVLEQTGDGRSTFYKKIAEGLFTPGVSLGGGRSVAWPDDEIDTIVNARIAGMNNDEIKDIVRRLLEKRKEMASSMDSMMSSNRWTIQNPTKALIQPVQVAVGSMKVIAREGQDGGAKRTCTNDSLDESGLLQPERLGESGKVAP